MLTGRFVEAINFAAIKHKDQRRKDKQQTPYINHPIGVAHILFFEGDVTSDEDVLIAAVLHDTVEDTQTTFEEIEGLFGPTVARIVKECTDDKSLAKNERKEAQVRLAPHKSDQAKLVKMADKIYNLRSLKETLPVGWTLERAVEYFQWGKRVTDGCKGVNKKLELVLDSIYQSPPSL